MKTKLILLATVTLTALSLTTGCVAIGNRGGQSCNATVGQQLIDLQKAKEAGVITDAEFQAQKAKLLEKK